MGHSKRGAYTVYDPWKKKFVITQDVKFDEDMPGGFLVNMADLENAKDI